MGLSLGTFSSLGNRSNAGNGGVVLVAVEGNTYLSVPILDFGAESSPGEGDGDLRMPSLSSRHTFGDTSPLTRFVIGLDEALRDYDGAHDGTAAKDMPRSRDLWSEDLFQNHLSVPPPAASRPEDASKAAAPTPPVRPRAALRLRCRDAAADEPQVVAVGGAEPHRSGPCVGGGRVPRYHACDRDAGPRILEIAPGSWSQGGDEERPSNPRRLVSTRAERLNYAPAA